VARQAGGDRIALLGFGCKLILIAFVVIGGRHVGIIHFFLAIRNTRLVTMKAITAPR
jgi:hypothetical protein